MNLQETKKGQLFITIPRAIARANAWRKGDHIEMVLNQRGEWVLRKVGS